jgi:hypothetical protein
MAAPVQSLLHSSSSETAQTGQQQLRMGSWHSARMVVPLARHHHKAQAQLYGRQQVAVLLVALACWPRALTAAHRQAAWALQAALSS